MATTSANDDASDGEDEATIPQPAPGKRHISTDVQSESRPRKIPRLLSPEKAELDMTVAICEAAWDHREELLKTATTQQAVEDIHEDEIQLVWAAAQGLGYRSARNFVNIRMVLLRYARQLVAFEGRLFPREREAMYQGSISQKSAPQRFR